MVGDLLLRIGTRARRRDLTAEEAAFVVASEAEVRSYAQSKGYTRHNWAAVLLFLVTVAPIFTSFFWLMSWVERLWNDVEVAAAVDGAHVVSLPFNVPLLLVLFPVGLLWGALPLVILSYSSRLFAEWRGWLGIAGTERYFSLRYNLARAVQKGRLSTKARIDSGRFLRDGNNEPWPYGLAILGVLTVVGAVMLYDHVRSYAVVTEAYVETAQRWTHGRIRVPLNLVRRVEVECYEGTRDFTVGYTLVLPSGDTVVLFRIGNLSRRLAAMEVIDSRLTRARVSFVSADGAFEPSCVSAVANRFDSADVGRVKVLLSIPKVAN